MSFVGMVIQFLVLVNPVAVLPVFIALTNSYSNQKKIIIAGKSLFAAFWFGCIFSVFGNQVLDSLSLSINALKVVGGFLLADTANKMINGRSEESAQKGSISIFPLAFPMLVGPGTLVKCVVSSVNPQDTTITVAALALILVFAFLLFASSSILKRFISKSGFTVLEKISGLIVGCIAVQYVYAGIAGLIMEG